MVYQNVNEKNMDLANAIQYPLSQTEQNEIQQTQQQISILDDEDLEGEMEDDINK